MAFNYRTDYHRYQQYYLNLKRYYQKPTVKVSFFILLSFFTVVFFSVFAIRPTVTTIGQLIREIEDKRIIDNALGNKLKSLDALQSSLLSIQSDVPLIFTALPTNSSLGRLMQAFEYLSQQKGVALISVQFEPVPLTEKPAQQTAEEINFTMSLGGSFSSLTDFLNDLERLDRVIVLSKVEFISAADNLRQQGIETLAEVEGKTFFLKEGTNLLSQDAEQRE